MTSSWSFFEFQSGKNRMYRHDRILWQDKMGDVYMIVPHSQYMYQPRLWVTERERER